MMKRAEMTMRDEMMKSWNAHAPNNVKWGSDCKLHNTTFLAFGSTGPAARRAATAGEVPTLQWTAGYPPSEACPTGFAFFHHHAARRSAVETYTEFTHLLGTAYPTARTYPRTDGPVQIGFKGAVSS